MNVLWVNEWKKWKKEGKTEWWGENYVNLPYYVSISLSSFNLLSSTQVDSSFINISFSFPSSSFLFKKLFQFLIFFYGTTDWWFQIGKGVRQGCILSPCLFNFYAEIMRNAGLEEAQAGIKIAGRHINNLRYADDTTLMAKSEEEVKSLLMKSERGEWKKLA